MKTESGNEENIGAVNLDTALSMTGMGKFHIVLLIVSGGCIASMTADSMGLSFALPTVACDLNLSAGEKGLFSAASFMGMILTTHGWGYASDTYGRRGVLLLSLGIGFLLTLCISLAPVLWVLVLLRFLAGGAYAGMGSTCYTYLAEFVPPRRRANCVAWMFLLEGSMFILLPAVSWFVLSLTWSFDLGFVVFRSWRLLVLLNGTYPLLLLLLMMWLPESPKFLVSVGKQQEAIDVLKWIFQTNTRRPPHDYPVHTIILSTEDERIVKPQTNQKSSFLTMLKAIRNQITPIFGRKHIRSTALAGILYFCMSSSAFGLYLWLPDIMNRIMNNVNVDPNASFSVCDAFDIQKNETYEVTCRSQIDSTVYIGSLLVGVVYCVGYSLVAILANVIGQRTMISALQIFSGLAGFGIYWASDSMLAAVLFFIYISLPCLALAPITAVVVDLYPTHLRSTAMCTAMTFGRIGSYLTGNLTGSLFEYNCITAVMLLGVISSGSALLAYFIPSPAKLNEPALESTKC